MLLLAAAVQRREICAVCYYELYKDTVKLRAWINTASSYCDTVPLNVGFPDTEIITEADI
jgi:hypothetical protein